MNTYAKITALYERLSIGDEQRGGEDSSSIKSQKTQLEQYAKQHGFANIRHYTDDDESGRFFDRTGYSQMMEDVESGKVGTGVISFTTDQRSQETTQTPCSMSKAFGGTGTAVE